MTDRGNYNGESDYHAELANKLETLDISTQSTQISITATQKNLRSFSHFCISTLHFHTL